MKRRSFIAGLLGIPLAGFAVKALANPTPVVIAQPLQLFDISLVKEPTDPYCVIQKTTEEYIRELQEKGIPIPNSMYLSACGFPGL